MKGVLLLGLQPSQLRAPVSGVDAPKEPTWLGWNAKEIIAVRFDLNVPKLSAGTEKRTVLEDQYLLLVLLPPTCKNKTMSNGQPWSDKDHHQCYDYIKLKWCSKYGGINAYRNVYVANEACCECGGGDWN